MTSYCKGILDPSKTGGFLSEETSMSTSGLLKVFDVDTSWGQAYVQQWILNDVNDGTIRI